MYALITDFDGTVTTFDVSHAIMRHFHADQIIGEPVHADDDDAKAWMRRHMGALRVTKKEFDNFVADTAVARDGLLPMLKKCFEKNIPVEIVSGGVDIYIKPFLLRHRIEGIPIFCANGTFTPEGIKVDYPLLDEVKLEDFKAMRVRRFKEQGYTTIYCGDGMTDLPAVLAADIPFACSHLLEYCRKKNIKVNELKTFKTVEEIIGA
ncbi:MAG: HAD-IB family phosphatase [Elusimicrobia bacterium]|nr:HAD-IB family phosphatase [Elusimicrobiota bacterium]